MYKYFSEHELACRCGQCETMMDDLFMEDLIAMREEAGFPFVITSAYRCEDYNRSIGGKGGSKHLFGQAVDILCHSEHATIILDLAKKYNMNGLGISQKGAFEKRFIHIDGRVKPAVWSY